MKLSGFLTILSEIFTTIEKLGVDTEPIVSALSPAAGAIEGAVVTGAGIGQAVLSDINQSLAATQAPATPIPAAPALAAPSPATAAATAPAPATEPVATTAGNASLLTDPATGNAAGEAAAQSNAQPGPGLHTILTA